MSDPDLVPVTVATSEAEAAMICGYLETHGIEAMYEKGGPSQQFSISGLGAAHVGGQAILVRAEDVEAARSALADRPE